jgi:hypothetical protein
MEDFFKPRGSTKASRPDSGDANIRTVPVFAVVKDNIDPIRSGRLRVYISDFSGSQPDNSSSWVTVSYMTPFYGRTNGNPPNTGYGNYKNNPHSYGMWTSPPDIGTTVICIFINGDPNFGFWIGCVPDPDALHMVPAIGASNKIIANVKEAESYGGALLLPVTNINPKDNSIAQTAEFLTANKPIHSYSAAVYAQQGLIRDTIRGPLTTNAQRETPSRVGFGVSTPGRPIYEGGFTDDTVIDNLDLKSPEKLKIIGRRGGHTFIMDDGDIVGNDKVIRLRTTLGHQILLSDSGQCLHIIHANGQSWIELGKEGTIDMYSTNSVNVRTQGDLNLHADNNINIHAKKDLSIQAESIKINSEKNIQVKAGADFLGYAMGKYTFKADGPMAMSSEGEGSYSSGGTMFVNGTKINLNTGKASTVPEVVAALKTFTHTDTLYDSVKGFAAAPGRLVSIVSRAPAHAPWANAGQGVNVKTTLSAEDNLPKPASDAIAVANSSAATNTSPGPTVTTISTVPPSIPVSNGIDKNTTSGLLSAQAVIAATGPGAQAVNTGTAVVQDSGSSIVYIGNFAMSPKRMEDGEYLKPGTAEKIMANIKSGMPPDKAFDPAFFTNKRGISNLSEFINNSSAQTDAQVTALQKTQTSLQAAGVMTGNESPNQIGGTILAGVQVGVTQVVGVMKSISGNVVGDLQNRFTAVKNVLGIGSNLANSISAGNMAANLTDKVTGGLSSISTSLSGIKNSSGLQGIIDSAKSVSESAFKAITASFKSFAANVPVDTLDEVKKNASTERTSTSANNLAAKVPGITLNQLGNGARNGSGVNNLPGGQQAIDAMVDSSGNLVAKNSASVAGTSNEVKNLSTSTTNNVPSVNGENIKGLIIGGLSSAAQILGSLPNKGNLAQTALQGLSAGSSAQLQSAISSIGSGGNSNIKMPQVAENTNDRASLDATTASSLNDPSIPPPNYSVSSQDRSASNARLQSSIARLNAEQQVENIEKAESLKKESEIAYASYIEAKNTLPQGDPRIEELRIKAVTESAKYQQNRLS